MFPMPCHVPLPRLLPGPQFHLSPGILSLTLGSHGRGRGLVAAQAQCWPPSACRYERLGEVVELLFPPVARGPSTDLTNPEYSNFCYWREPLPTVDLDTLD